MTEDEVRARLESLWDNASEDSKYWFCRRIGFLGEASARLAEKVLWSAFDVADQDAIVEKAHRTQDRLVVLEG